MNTSARPLEQVDPHSTPQFTLANGARIPSIGIGTFGSDHAPAELVAEAVRDGARVGYRHFDCAAVYGNEKEIGDALRDVTSCGVSREDLWITSKLWNDKHAKRTSDAFDYLMLGGNSMPCELTAMTICLTSHVARLIDSIEHATVRSKSGWEGVSPHMSRSAGMSV